LLPDVDQLLLELSSDSVVRVRQTVVESIPFLLELSEPPRVVFQVLSLLGRDEAISIAVGIPPVLALLGPSHRDFVLPIADTILASRVWQAHAVLVANIDHIFPTDPPLEFVRRVSEIAYSPVISAAVARQLKFFFVSKCYATEQEFADFALTLVGHPYPPVKIAVAGVLGTMPPGARTFVETAVTALLADKEQEVALAALHAVAQSGLAQDAATQRVAALAESHQWRVKKAIVDLLPQFAQTFDQAVFKKDIVPVLSVLFADDAAAVRLAIIGILPHLVAKFGAEWQADVVVKMIRDGIASGDFHIRETAISAIIRLRLEAQLADLIQKAAQDPVANVRIILAQELPRNSDVLERLKSDPDRDVADYAFKP
jgi:hypothetical protein